MVDERIPPRPGTAGMASPAPRPDTPRRCSSPIGMAGLGRMQPCHPRGVQLADPIPATHPSRPYLRGPRHRPQRLSHRRSRHRQPADSARVAARASTCMPPATHVHAVDRPSIAGQFSGHPDSPRQRWPGVGAEGGKAAGGHASMRRRTGLQRARRSASSAPYSAGVDLVCPGNQVGAGFPNRSLRVAGPFRTPARG